jgi:type I restriction enzyme S subunit
MSEPLAAILQALPRRFRSYPEYKDSGVEWLGEIPMHWKVQRLKFAAHIEAGQSPSSESVAAGADGLPFLQGNAEFGPRHPVPHLVCNEASKRAKVGDLLLSVRAPVGALNIADQPYGIGRGLCAITPGDDLEPQFCYYVLWTVRSRLDAVSTGSTYEAVTASDVGDLPALLPSRNEQRAIGAFLDRETAKIDALVAKKERVIELLQEKRIALITQAVTKGLDPNVPMKDSGVEWLGQIPAHWAVVRLRFLLRRIEQGWSPLAEQREAGEDEWAVLKVGCVNEGRFDQGEHKALPPEITPPVELEIREGDVLLSRANTRELLGSAAVVTKVRPRLLLCDKLYRLTVDSERIEPRYLVPLLAARSARHQLEVEAVGASNSMQNITQATIRDLVVAVPQRVEQVKILDFIEQEAGEIDGLTTKIRDGIERLKEFRTALISAAVTGKIDVREGGV